MGSENGNRFIYITIRFDRGYHVGKLAAVNRDGLLVRTLVGAYFIFRIGVVKVGSYRFALSLPRRYPRVNYRVLR